MVVVARGAAAAASGSHTATGRLRLDHHHHHHTCPLHGDVLYVPPPASTTQICLGRLTTLWFQITVYYGSEVLSSCSLMHKCCCRRCYSSITFTVRSHKTNIVLLKDMRKIVYSYSHIVFTLLSEYKTKHENYLSQMSR